MRTVDPSHNTFIKTIHDRNAGSHLVDRSQDNGNVDEEKMNETDANDVPLQLDITTLTHEMKPSQKKLF